ncbi:DUF1194 domain-containing protein [Endozoicomonas sp. SM1973]|uniref:DUF1194 domain-containing protein n=1 Tax=Spartinivicinus marinus TaxID=2994442 RepID=A0A853I9U4_9GAMM|nr:DUF1194 domain-containing protein [Spartinivicinus marinus]MCX4026462.1 DUF1194 domain-containing protein [Spartinivicinus marinus]NYZ66834.1 DUF1194 domain-containing protein [Spartinivicinus marinus]
MKPIKTIALVTALLPFTLINTAQAVPVDKELALVIDVSSSIDDTEFALQMNGYAAAFKDPDVINAILALPNGNGIAAAAFPFAAFGADDPMAPASYELNSTPWFHITDAMSAMDFANAISAIPNGDAQGTNIAGGVDSAVNSMLNNDFEGDMLIVDVSTDGVQNLFRDGGLCIDIFNLPPSEEELLACLAAFDSAINGARDEADGQGVMINGLAITDLQMAEDYLSDLIDILGQETVDMLGLPENLQEYLELHLITEEGFVLTTEFDETQFASAVKQKILNEISTPDEPTPMPEPGTAGILAVCLLGLFLHRRRLQQVKI